MIRFSSDEVLQIACEQHVQIAVRTRNAKSWFAQGRQKSLMISSACKRSELATAHHVSPCLFSSQTTPCCLKYTVKHKRWALAIKKGQKCKQQLRVKSSCPANCRCRSVREADSLTVNRIQVTRGAFSGHLKCFTPCPSAIKPVAACCQSYQRDWQRPQKGTARLR